MTVCRQGRTPLDQGCPNFDKNLIFTDQWRIITNVVKQKWRSKPGVAAHNSKIYVTGGWDFDSDDGECVKMSSVECYDPDTNTWSQVSNMNIPRAGHSLISLHGRMYAIGGYDVDNVEVYDLDNDKWTLLECKLKGKVTNTGAGLIKKHYVDK